MRFFVYPYKQGSRSAKALAVALGGRVLKLEGSNYKPKDGDVVINWGNSKSPWNDDDPHKLLNYHQIVARVANKANFFSHLLVKNAADIAPAFWFEKHQIPNDAFPVVCRTILSGHSGAGILMAYNRDGLVPAPLYVQYRKKKDEYRIHVGKTAEGPCLISVQRKARRLECSTPNWTVRNHQNGFVYVRQNVQPPACVINAAYKAFDCLGLDFGAIDVIYNEKKDRAWVLEVNTAPGLEGQTVEDYKKFFLDNV